MSRDEPPRFPEDSAPQHQEDNRLAEANSEQVDPLGFTPEERLSVLTQFTVVNPSAVKRIYNEAARFDQKVLAGIVGGCEEASGATALASVALTRQLAEADDLEGFFAQLPHLIEAGVLLDLNVVVSLREFTNGPKSTENFNRLLACYLDETRSDEERSLLLYSLAVYSETDLAETAYSIVLPAATATKSADMQQHALKAMTFFAFREAFTDWVLDQFKRWIDACLEREDDCSIVLYRLMEPMSNLMCEDIVDRTWAMFGQLYEHDEIIGLQGQMFFRTKYAAEALELFRLAIPTVGWEMGLAVECLRTILLFADTDLAIPDAQVVMELARHYAEIRDVAAHYVALLLKDRPQLLGLSDASQPAGCQVPDWVNNLAK